MFRHRRSLRAAVPQASAGLSLLAALAAGGIALAQGAPRAETIAPPGLTQPDRPPTPNTSGSSTFALTTSMEVLDDKDKLGKGDRVSFRVVEDRREPVALYVTDSGEMEVPLIGRVKALNKTCKQLAYEIKPLLEQEYFVKATVIIGLEQLGGKSRGKVMVTGQVRQQGMLELLPGEPLTLSQAIVRAGGFADFANKKEVRLVRKRLADPEPPPRAARKPSRKPGFLGRVFGKREEPENLETDTYLIDLSEILEKGHLEKDPVLEPGDLIVVPERLFNF